MTGESAEAVDTTYAVNANHVVCVTSETQREKEDTPDGAPNHRFRDDGDAHGIRVEVGQQHGTTKAENEHIVPGVPDVPTQRGDETCGLEHRIEVVPERKNSGSLSQAQLAELLRGVLPVVKIKVSLEDTGEYGHVVEYAETDVRR